MSKAKVAWAGGAQRGCGAPSLSMTPQEYTSAARPSTYAGPSSRAVSIAGQMRPGVPLRSALPQVRCRPRVQAGAKLPSLGTLTSYQNTPVDRAVNAHSCAVSSNLHRYAGHSMPLYSSKAWPKRSTTLP